MTSNESVGHKFGRWTVIERVSGGKAPKVKCVCDCGNVSEIYFKTLVSKTSKSTSCGCYQRERISEVMKLGEGVSALNQVYSTYKTSAKIRNHVFEISKVQFYDLIKSNCYYCDKSPCTIKKTKNGTILFNGIDRVDNSKGYILTNCVPCCTDCNYNKNNVNINIIEKAYRFLHE